VQKLWSTLSKIGLAEEVPENQANPVASPTVPATQAEHKKPVQPAVDSSLAAKVDEESRAQLLQSLEAHQFPIIDELNNILGPLKDVITDETLRYTTALNIVGKKFHFTKLLEDYDRRLGVLDETQRQFTTALGEQLEKRVGSKIRNVQKMDGDIQNLQGEIANLASKLTEIQAAREAEHSGVAKEQARLDLTQERFDLAHKEIRGNMERERLKVAECGKGVK
jgi:hypothetical protein